MKTKIKTTINSIKKWMYNLLYGENSKENIVFIKLIIYWILSYLMSLHIIASGTEITEYDVIILILFCMFVLLFLFNLVGWILITSDKIKIYIRKWLENHE